jgi:predicted permease
VLIPAIFGVILFLCGVRNAYLLIPLLVLSMPIGVNMVVFPESIGLDSRENAKTLFVSYLFALAALPLTFSLISHLSTLAPL